MTPLKRGHTATRSQKAQARFDPSQPGAVSGGYLWLNWQKQTGAKRTFLIHGEEDVMKQFATHLGDTHVEMPLQNQSFEL
jgi:hypothetical protein